MVSSLKKGETVQLTDNIWLVGPYFMEVDELGQLRVAGPQNHLYFGLVGTNVGDFSIDQVSTREGQLEVSLTLAEPVTDWPDPAMDHIRRVRQYVELSGEVKPTFATVRQADPEALRPAQVSAKKAAAGLVVRYARRYQGNEYGVEVEFPAGSRYDEQARLVRLRAGVAKRVVVRTVSTVLPAPQVKQIVRRLKLPTTFDSALVDLASRSAIEIEHLVGFGKTSGFEYGTVFPRDWMEAADLGAGDLTTKATEYMYHRALEFVSEEGEGWHENLVGEFLYEEELQYEEARKSLGELAGRSTNRILGKLASLLESGQQQVITRYMIDIEPHYILGLQLLRWDCLSDYDRLQLDRVAQWVVKVATKQPLVTFKKIPPVDRRHGGEVYYGEGNWRDSRRAFKMVHPIIAPYDVNVVFYPQALRLIAEHADKFKVDPQQVELLISKWDRVREWYRFTNPDGTSAYALALYDVKISDQVLGYRRLEVNHLDESYEFFYGDPSETDAVSFAQRVLDPQYFYSPSGPLLVDSHSGYSTLDYHGRVSWAKQTAYTVAGLRRIWAKQQGSWSFESLQLLHRAALETATNSLKAFVSLGGAPELHYDRKGQAHFYNDQPQAEGPMNKVQLWSAVGARRIMREFLELQQDGHV